MKQRAHAWVALRALKLIDDSGKLPGLIELLSYYLSDVWEGAWLPDTLIVDMSYGHIFKMESDPAILGFEPSKERFQLSYKELKSRFSGRRLCLEYIMDSAELTKSYRTHYELSGHLPDRVIALSHTIGDMLKMSDYPLAFYARKKRSKTYQEDLSAQAVKDLSLSPNFSARQIALTFFILSHYICDAHMPLHCDLRDYGDEKIRRLPKGLHPSIEEKWETFFPPKEAVTLHSHLRTSIDEVVTSLPKVSLIKIDSNNEYRLDEKIADIKGDEWQEMVYVARVSFAVARKWIDRPYADVEDLILSKSEEEFKKVTNFIFHDAVESVARIWTKAWKRFIE